MNIIKRIACGLISLGMVIKCVNNNVAQVKADTSIKADINGDGIISVSDIICIKQYLLSKNEFEDIALSNADIDGNGKVDILDMILIVEMMLECNDNVIIPNMTDPTQDKVKSSVAEMVNKKRMENGFSALTLDAKLSYVADVRAEELSQKFDFNRPDGSAYNFLLNQYRADAAYTYQYIMRSMGSASDVFDTMLVKSAFLDADYKKIGVGYNGKSLTYCTVFLTS